MIRKLIDRAYAGTLNAQLQSKRAARMVLVGACTMVAYRRGHDVPMIDDGMTDTGVKKWRFANTKECADSAIDHGVVLADRLTRAFFGAQEKQ